MKELEQSLTELNSEKNRLEEELKQKGIEVEEEAKYY